MMPTIEQLEDLKYLLRQLYRCLDYDPGGELGEDFNLNMARIDVWIANLREQQ